MTVTVQFWAQCARVAGRREARVDLPAGATVALLLKEVYARWPELSAFDKTLLVAVGLEWANRGQALKDGDGVMLAPPVAGG
ncbi:MAG: MoaD/ThiS family protein [Verrucomicrobia bacterium]|nr:MoaD/ThiS family protein [Verrucomicrobiota bacterium]